MSRIDHLVIEQIKQAADIVEVVGDYVSLKQKGANHWACCPFHGEKSPSFSVSAPKGLYKCFGCGKGGDATSFIMEIEGVSYPEALKVLAKKYGIEIVEKEYTDEQLIAANQKESLYIILDYAKNFYNNHLQNSEHGQSIGLSYFKERGFNQATIDTFQLGMSPQEWDTFSKKAQTDSFQLPILESSGLSIVKRDEANPEQVKVYDRFRERVIFPIHNVTGRVVAFGGRILVASKTQPKYVNSPETDVYHKSDHLYGIFQAKNAIRTKDMVYLCEGYTDVISLHQAGIHNVVASSGTSLTKEQIQLIRRFTQNITVLYDGDSAGIKAALRGMDMILEAGLNVKLTTFPDGEDPDSYVKRIGSEAFIEYIRSNSKDFISFKAELSLKEAGDDPVLKANVIKDMVESISKIPDAIKKQAFIQKTASLMGISEALLIQESNKISLKKHQENQAPAKSVRPNLDSVLGESFDEESDVPFGGFIPTHEPIVVKTGPIEAQEKETIRLLLNFGNHVPDPIENPEITLTGYMLFEMEDVSLRTPIFQEILTEIRTNFDQGSILVADHFFNSPNQVLKDTVIGLCMEKYEASENWFNMHQIHVTKDQEKLVDLASTNIYRVKREHLLADQKVLKDKMLTAQSAEEQSQLLGQFIENQRIEKAIGNHLGVVISKRK
jgi:DNA primase